MTCSMSFTMRSSWRWRSRAPGNAALPLKRTKMRKSEKENDTKNENTVKNNQLYGTFCRDSGSGRPRYAARAALEKPRRSSARCCGGRKPRLLRQIPRRYSQHSLPARLLLCPRGGSCPCRGHSGPGWSPSTARKRSDATEVQPAPQPFRAAAGEAQLDVPGERTPQPTRCSDRHGSMGHRARRPGELKPPRCPISRKNLEQPEQPEQLGFDVPAGRRAAAVCGRSFPHLYSGRAGRRSCA